MRGSIWSVKGTTLGAHKFPILILILLCHDNALSLIHSNYSLETEHNFWHMWGVGGGD